MKIDFSNNKKFIIRKNCVLCGSKSLKEVLNFKKTPLANSYVSNKNSREIFFPLVCIHCDNCKHLQLKHLVNPKLLFENYLYVSGTSPVLIDHFKNYFLKILRKKKLNLKKDKILDIACNDGTFLNFFVKKGFSNVVGIEPAKNLRELNTKKKIDIITNFFSFKNSFKIKKKYKSFKIITANNVMAHVPDIRDFSLGVKNILSKDGLFIFEVSYLKNVIEKLTFDTIYHEHMSYHALAPLEIFFESIDMKLIDFDLVKAQGGSIRVYVGHKNLNANKKKIRRQINIEKKMGLLDRNIYKLYFRRITEQRNKIKKLIDKKILNNQKVLIGYGAPAKVTTFAYAFNLSKKHIKFIVDDNDLKQGKFTPGKNIKIIKFDDLKDLDFNYIIILAWNFADPIIQKLKKLIKKKKFKIIVPFPKLKIY